MGLTKQYLRYCQSGLFGLVATSKANVLLVEVKGQRGKYAAVPAVEHVFIWDLRKGEKVFVLEGDKHEVMSLAKSRKTNQLAVGYSNGSIRIFDLTSGSLVVTFNGHKSSVSTLKFSPDDLRLASGSKDTDVILWDIVNETGLYRMKGHKGMVTDLAFMTNRNILITCSKDTFVKFWNLDTQHCFKTLVGHRTEIWSLCLLPKDRRLITGAMESELKVWDITFKDEVSPGENEEETGPSPEKKQRTEDPEELEGDRTQEDAEGRIQEGEEDIEDETSVLSCTKVGTLRRSGKDRVVTMDIDATGRLLCCHGKDSYLEVFLIGTEEENKKLLLKKRKRARKKLSKSNRETEESEAVDDASITLEVSDEIRSLGQIKAAGKIRSFDAFVGKDGKGCILLLLQNNKLDLFKVDPTEKQVISDRISSLSMPGHRSDVRTAIFSSDNTAILTGSAERVKLWNRSSLQCLRTMECGYSLSVMFVPGDRHCIVGTKEGHIQLFDIASGELLKDEEAHEGSVWSLALAPNKRGFVSGSADKTMKFWEFEFATRDVEDSSQRKMLSFAQTRTLQMSDDVLCIKYSADQKFIAASLLDSTVKIFFVDTLKFFLSLYGHKLPVLTMDISSDSSLIVTGSADRNVKIWGMDFGDCHKSLFAHDDSVMCVQFVPKTHLFFTCGKDGKVKQWDGDHFVHILTLEGHKAEIWTLAVSPSGDFVVSASHDKSLRLWERTDEPLVLEEEREMEREKEYEESLSQSDPSVIPGETSTEVTLAGKRTVETVKGAERIMEALELYKEEMVKIKEHEHASKSQNRKLPPPKPHPILEAFGNISPLKYVLEVLKKVKSSELEESLLVMPFHYIIDLLPLLEKFISNGWEVELSCRCLFFLLRVHFGQITSNQLLLPVIDRLRKSTVAKVAQLKDTVGFNLAGLQYMSRELEAKQEVHFFADATDHFKERKRKKKKLEGKAVLAMAAAGL